MPERVMVFIDGSNLYNTMKEVFRITRNVKVDAFAKKLSTGRDLQRTYYYNSPAPPTVNQAQSQAYWDSLGWLDTVRPRLGRIVRRVLHTKCPLCQKEISIPSYVQKGVDTRMVVDMISLAHQNAYDVAILVSGDSDLTETVEWIREHTQKRVINAFIPSKSWSKQLREAAEARIALSADFLKDCLT